MLWGKTSRPAPRVSTLVPFISDGVRNWDLNVSLLERSDGVRSWDLNVSLLERCPHFRGCYEWSWDLEDVSLLERCPRFRGCCVQASMELGSPRHLPHVMIQWLTFHLCNNLHYHYREGLGTRLRQGTYTYVVR